MTLASLRRHELAGLLGVHVDVLTEGACHGPFATILDHAAEL